MFNHGKSFLWNTALLAGLIAGPAFAAVPKKDPVIPRRIVDSCEVVNKSQKRGQPKQVCSIARTSSPGSKDSFTVTVTKNLVRDETGGVGSKVRIGSNYYPFKLNPNSVRANGCKQMRLSMNFILLPDITSHEKRAKLVSLESYPVCSGKIMKNAQIMISMNDSGKWSANKFQVPPPAERTVATRTFRLLINKSSGSSDSVSDERESRSASRGTIANHDTVPARTPPRSNSPGLAADEDEEDEEDYGTYSPPRGADSGIQTASADGGPVGFGESAAGNPSMGDAPVPPSVGPEATAFSAPPPPPPGAAVSEF